MKRFAMPLAVMVLVLNVCAAPSERPTEYTPPPAELQAALRSLTQQRSPDAAPKLENFGGKVLELPSLDSQRGDWQITHRERDQQVWTTWTSSRDSITGREVRRLSEIVELGSGLNYRDAKGQWQSTREEFQRAPDGGFIAEFGPHRLVLENNINSITAVDFLSSDGVRLRSGPLAVGYYDPVDGRNVILGTVRDTAGELTAPNEVTYRSAFDGLDASIRVTYRRAGMSADLILNEMPPEPAAFGLSDQSRLELYTEFHPAMPLPRQTTRLLRSEPEPDLRKQMVEPDFTDTILEFGDYSMPTGTAFEMNEAASPSKVPVAKRLSVIDGRPVLIEAVEWQAAKPLMSALIPANRNEKSVQRAAVEKGAKPGLGEASDNHSSKRLARHIPQRPQPGRIQSIQEARVRNSSHSPAFVLDYSLVAGSTNMTFASDKTYFVKSDVYLYGNTVFENAVIKYTNYPASAALRIKGTVEFKTTDYTPLVLTSQNDNSIGESLPWSTGNPWTNYCGLPALEIDSYTSGQTATIKHVRVSHAYTAFSFYTGTGHEVKHVQIVHCSSAFTPYYADVRLRNVLVHLADRVVSGSGAASATMRFEHLTASAANYLNWDTWSGPSSTTLLTNSLFVAVTNVGTYSGANNASNTTSSSVFTVVGAGAHYLSGTAYRGLGTTNINASLLSEIRARTTQPPLLSTNGSIVADTVLNPRATLRYGAGASPDIGFHYPILDHVLGSISMTNAQLTVAAGTVVGLTISAPGNYALLLAGGARLVAEGSPTNLVRMPRCHLVQEQANNAWTGHGYSLVLPWWSANPVPSISLRFAQIATVADEIILAYGQPAALSLRDCQIYGGSTYNLSGSSVGVTNCLWDRVLFSADFSATPGVAIRNNLFRGGTLELFPNTDTSIRDNLFDKTAIPYFANVSNSHNAYLVGSDRLLPTNSTDKVLVSLTYEAGALGRHYLPTTSVLINAGSQSAADAGLFHFTTTTNQVLEANSVVDIGLHYSGIGTNGMPNDSDGDGLLNLVEDKNGNGARDTGETDMFLADTDGDGLTDYQEIVLIGSTVTNPLLWDTNGNGVNDADDDADGDLISNRGELALGTNPIDAFSLNRASNGNAANKDAEFIAAAVMSSQGGNALARLKVPSGGDISPPNITLYLLDVAAPFIYNIYYTSDLNLPWQLHYRGANNQSTFTVNMPPGNGFFQAGSAQDWDGDGLPDGYETIVSKTRIDVADTDGDGMSDGWEVANSLNPKSNADAAQDADGDGISNLQEYLAHVNSIRPTERLGPSSRRTPLVISEIMYHSAGGDALDYIELYNTHFATIDLSNYQLWFGDNPVNRLVFTFPASTTLAPNAFLLVVRNSASYSTIPNQVGIFSRDLSDNSERIRLVKAQGTEISVLLDVEYDDDAPWPLHADGAGHALVLSRPSYGENDPRAWAASRSIGGSPGVAENSLPHPLDAIKINEFLADPTAGQEDYIELYNAGNVSVDISGCFLSDSSNNLVKFSIPLGTVLNSGNYVHFVRNQAGSFTFGLPASGGAVFLSSPWLANAQSIRVLDAVRYFSQEDGISMGRTPNGASEFNQLAVQSPGNPNGAALIRGGATSPGNIVINELMFNPISGNDDDEYIELYNAGATAQSLQGWSISGVGFTFSTAFTLQPGNFVVVARNKQALAARYPAGQLTDGVNLVGNFPGGSGLANSGERIALINNSAGTGVVVDEVTYGDGGRWGRWIDRDGASLELRDHHSNNRLPSNWGDATAPNSATWTTVETVDGTLIQGYPDSSPINALEIILLGVGECLVDNVEVIAAGGVYKIGNGNGNGTFDSGISGWTPQGSHDLSAWSSTGGYNDNGGCLYLRSTGTGDYLDNRILSADWSPALTANSTATIRAKVRWLRGHPEIVFRLRANWLEAAGTLSVPASLGSPGLVNSGGDVNIGPALTEISHFPVLPKANEAVLVTARVHDPNGIASILLRYRTDPNTSLTDVQMNDAGTDGDRLGGDGLYTAKIPGQAANTLVAFRIEAIDSLSVSSRFPPEEIVYPGDTQRRECLVRFGETLPTTTGVRFGSYRFWMSQATLTQWNTRRKGHNSGLDVTFVYDGIRALYNAGAEYSGSPNTVFNYNGPLNSVCGYRIGLSKDEKLFGATDLILKPRDTGSIVAEQQLAYWLADQMGVRSLRRSFVHLHVNGQLRGVVYEDSQKPGGEFLEQWFPGADEGEFFKLEVWRQTTDGAVNVPCCSYQPANFTVHNRPDGTKNVARYRWNFEKQQGFKNDYTTLFGLVDVMAQNPLVTSAVEGQANMENWMRTFALQRAVGNVDSYGYWLAHNMYAYKAPGKLWELIIWDLDYVRNDPASTSLYSFVNQLAGPQNQNPEVERMFNHPPFQRAYLRGLRDAANGPMQTAAYNAFLNAATRALADNGIATGPINFTTTYLDQRRNKILTEPQLQSPPVFAITSNNGQNFTTTQSSVTLAGTAPVEVVTTQMSSSTATAGTLVWPTVTTWNLPLTLAIGANVITVQGFDRLGQPLQPTGTYTKQITITRQ